MELQHTFTVPADLDTVWRAVLDAELVAPCMPGATLTKVDGDTFSGTVKVKLGPVSLLYKGAGEFLEKDEAAHQMRLRASGKDTRGNGTAAATVTVTLRADGAATVGTVRTNLNVTGKPAQFGRGMISEVGGKILDAFATCLASRLAEPRAGAGPAGTSGPPSNGTAMAPSAPAPASPPHQNAPEARTAAAAQSRQGAGGHRPDLSVVEAPGEQAARNGSSQRPRPPLTAVPEPEAQPMDLLSFAAPAVVKRAAPLLLVLLVLLIAMARRRRGR